MAYNFLYLPWRILIKHLFLWSIFAAQVVTDDPIDFMDQPPAGLVIQGLLRPAFLEEHTTIPKKISEHKSNDAGLEQMEQVAEHKQNGSVQINGHKHESESSQDNPSCPEELEKDETLGNGTSFYKLEMIKIQLISSLGQQVSFVRLSFMRFNLEFVDQHFNTYLA